NISRVYVNKQLIAENVTMSSKKGSNRLTMVDQSESKRDYRVDEIKSLEFTFHEAGPLYKSYWESIVVLTFNDSQRLFNHEINFGDSVVLVFNHAFTYFSGIQNMVIRHMHHLSRDIVRLLSFGNWPKCVLETLPLFAHTIATEIRERLDKEKAIKPKGAARGAAGQCVALSSDEEDHVLHPPTYYDIDGERQQISEAGLNSLNDRNYMNDEVINLAFGRIQKKYPNVYVFDSYTTQKMFDLFESAPTENNVKMPHVDFTAHFGKFFCKKRSDDTLEWFPMDQTFFDKKLLIFPICHMSHWYIMVVVNPLLANATYVYGNKKPNGPMSRCYYIDSLKGTDKYPFELMKCRLDLSWGCIYSFLYLAGIYNPLEHIMPEFINCKHGNNFPSQTNTYDCGAHAIVNAEVIAEMYDQMMLGPPTLTVSKKKVKEMKNRVDGFRDEFNEYLDKARI
ncbi:hypothetical protein PFISCL1PPCAC_1674, partial [Pristionchus fissidentatus]